MARRASMSTTMPSEVNVCPPMLCRAPATETETCCSLASRRSRRSLSIAAASSPGNLSIARTRGGSQLAKGTLAECGPHYVYRGSRNGGDDKDRNQARREAPHDPAAAGVLHLLDLSRSVCCGEVQIQGSRACGLQLELGGGARAVKQVSAPVAVKVSLMASPLSRSGATALKGILISISTTALAVSAAAAYYGRRGWVLPDQEQGFYRAFVDLMVSFATYDQPNGAIALLCAVTLAAVSSGALVGRFAARVAGSPADRAGRIARTTLLAYVASAMGIPIALGFLNALLLARLEWSLPFLWLYGLVGAVALLPLAVAPLVGAVLLLERWTRPTGETRSAHAVAALLVGMAAVTALLGTFAVRQYLRASWKLSTASGAVCSVHRGMSRRFVRESCGRPSDFGVERNRFIWALSAPRTCDVPVDAYKDQLVLYDCRQELVGVDSFAGRGLHRKCVA